MQRRARYMRVDQELLVLDLLGTVGAVLILVMLVIVVRHRHLKLPYNDSIDGPHLS